METFTIGLRSPWWVRALGRGNPLVRPSDRIEAVVLVAAVMLTVLVLPIAGAVGTNHYEQRSRVYAEEAQARHQVLATATGDGQIVPQLRSLSFAAEATWSEAGKTQRALVPWNGRAKVGDQQTIWVDNQGGYAGPPGSSSRATGEAVVVALAVWLGVAEASAASVYLIRRRLNHRRYAQWEREINASHFNDGRRNHRP